MKNGLFNNLFAIKKNRDYNYDVVKFITGFDCHVWESYPAHDSSKMEVDRATEFKHTYLKCLPTFKGLAMALTDYSRIHLGNNFFSLDEEKIHEINISIDSQEISVPLSNGINAIIGDNSIGKSLLLHKLTNFKNVKPTIKKGYLEYLKNKNISINTIIDDSKIYYFDFQGNIRDRFEKKDEANNQSFLNEQFPEPPANVEYIAQINKQFENLYTLLDTKFNYDKKLTTLKTVLIPESGTTRKFVTCIKLQFNKKRLDGLIKAINYLTKLLATIKDPNELDFLDTSDKTELIKIKNTVEQMIKRYSEKKEVESKKYNIMVGIREGINKYSNDLSSLKSNEETIVENYENDQVENVQTIADLLYLKSNIKPHKFSIDNPIKANFSKLVYSNYSFVRRFKNVRVISNDYLDSVLSRCLKNNKKIDILNITIGSFKNDILKDYSDSTLSPINFLKARIDEIIKDDFNVESVILFNNENIYENLSSGLNSTIYFDIISDDTSKGIYLVDQPEDDVSQLSIKRNLIKDFKNMSQKRQIILVTHNPQFVVNLDVDNVICLYKNDNGKLFVSSGALEYEDDNTNIIKLVADNLDGGADSIRKRWKRYEKDFEVR